MDKGQEKWEQDIREMEDRMLRDQKVLIRWSYVVIGLMILMIAYNIYNLEFTKALPFVFLLLLNLWTQKNLKVSHNLLKMTKENRDNE